MAVAGEQQSTTLASADGGKRESGRGGLTPSMPGRAAPQAQADEAAQRRRRRRTRPRGAATASIPAVTPPARSAPSRSAQLADLIPKATSLIEAWEARFGAYDAHAASEPDA